MGKVTCKICEMALVGTPMTPQQIDSYNRAKMGMRDVSLLRIEDDPVVNGQKFTLRSMGGLVMRAMGFPKPKTATLESVQTSLSRRRPRLFDSMDMEEEPLPANAAFVGGSMEEIDAALRKGKE